MLPGGGAMHLNDSLGHCRELDYVCMLHEQAAAIAAEAYARVTNHLGVAVVAAGPAGQCPDRRRRRLAGFYPVTFFRARSSGPNEANMGVRQVGSRKSTSSLWSGR